MPSHTGDSSVWAWGGMSSGHRGVPVSQAGQCRVQSVCGSSAHLLYSARVLKLWGRGQVRGSGFASPKRYTWKAISERPLA
jgi:hypothetical protein